MPTVPQPRLAFPNVALSIKTAERESPMHPTATADSGSACASPEAPSIESPLLESPSIATPRSERQPTRAPNIRLVDEAFDLAWTGDYLSSSMTHAQVLLHPQPQETLKTPVQENHSLLHLLDSNLTWSDTSDALTAPYQEIEPEHHQASAGLGWFRGLGRWFGHSKQAAVVVPEVKIELDDMPVDEFPIIPHTSGEYKPPWLSLTPLHPPGHPIVATLDFSAFDRIVDEPFTHSSSNESDEHDSH